MLRPDPRGFGTHEQLVVRLVDGESQDRIAEVVLAIRTLAKLLEVTGLSEVEIEHNGNGTDPHLTVLLEQGGTATVVA